MKKYTIKDKNHTYHIKANDLDEAIKQHVANTDEYASLNIAIDKLIEEEQEAIESYTDILASTSNDHATAVFGHILAEEQEHLKELIDLKQHPVKDAKIKDNDIMFRRVKKDILHHCKSIIDVEEIEYAVETLVKNGNLSKDEAAELNKMLAEKRKQFID